MTQQQPSKSSSGFSKNGVDPFETLVLTRQDETKAKQILLLKPQEGYKIKDLIDRLAPGNYRQYCEKIGMSPPNFHAVLGGGRTCSLETLNKILSGIRYEAQVSFTIVIQALPTGEDVPDAVSALDDDEFVCEETEPTPTPVQPQSESFSLVKPQELQKMLQDFPLLDPLDE